MWKRIAVVSVLLVLTAGGYFYESPRSTTEAFITAPIERGSIVTAITATGTLNAVLSVTVGSYVSGVIRELRCDYNSEVKQGEICAIIDPRPFQTIVEKDKANLAVARAQLEKDKAALEYARVKYERNAKLVRQDSIALDVLDAAKSEYQQAQAQIDYDQATIAQRQAELGSSMVNLEYTVIASPVDGIVVSRSVTVGQTVAANFQTPTLFTIAKDLREMEVDAKIDEADVGYLRPGQAVSFTVDAFPERTFTGRILQIRKSPEVVQNVVTYTAVISAPNADQALLPGMTANLRIVVADTGTVLKVPNQALRFRPRNVPRGQEPGVGVGAATVWTPGTNGAPVSVEIKVGQSDDTGTQLLSSNLGEGDQVIIGFAKAVKRESSLQYGPKS